MIEIPGTFFSCDNSDPLSQWCWSDLRTRGLKAHFHSPGTANDTFMLTLDIHIVPYVIYIYIYNTRFFSDSLMHHMVGTLTDVEKTHPFWDVTFFQVAPRPSWLGLVRMPRSFSMRSTRASRAMSIEDKCWEAKCRISRRLGGGFKDFLCSPLFGEDFQFD